MLLSDSLLLAGLSQRPAVVRFVLLVVYTLTLNYKDKYLRQITLTKGCQSVCLPGDNPLTVFSLFILFCVDDVIFCSLNFGFQSKELVCNLQTHDPNPIQVSSLVESPTVASVAAYSKSIPGDQPILQSHWVPVAPTQTSEHKTFTIVLCHHWSHELDLLS